MKHGGYFLIALCILFFGSIAFNQVKEDVRFRDACRDKGGVFTMVGHDRKCYEAKEIQL